MWQNLSEFRLPENFRGRPAWFVQFWWLIQSLLFKTSPQFMYGWRRFLLRCFGAQIGKKVLFRSSVTIQFPWKLNIGNYSWVGDYVVLYSLGEIKIGSNAVVSQRSYLCSGTHDYTDIAFRISAAPIIIEDECWIATDVYIAPGITIGKGTVVGARSSVFSSLPAGKICFGNPARVIRNRKSDHA